MTPEVETGTALLAVLVSALTQIGVPGVFVFAWWHERTAHEVTQRRYERDMRRCAGLTVPEDIVGGSGD